MRLETAMELVERNLTGRSQNSRAAMKLLRHIQSEEQGLTRLRAKLEYLESEDGPDAVMPIAEVYRLIGRLPRPAGSRPDAEA